MRVIFTVLLHIKENQIYIIYMCSSLYTFMLLLFFLASLTTSVKLKSLLTRRSHIFTPLLAHETSLVDTSTFPKTWSTSYHQLAVSLSTFPWSCGSVRGLKVSKNLEDKGAYVLLKSSDCLSAGKKYYT